MQVLHGYTLDETAWRTKGGNGQCNIAEKNGKKFFIKQLIWPKYPKSDRFTGEFRERKIAECNQWYRQRREIIRQIPGSGTGTTVKPIEYFLDGACYYEVANLVDVVSIPYTEIHQLSADERKLAMMTAAMSLSDLHKKGIVHGDLDPGNILISRATGGSIVTKLIDFTDAFFAKDPPKTIMSKDFWWSPEVALYSIADAKGEEPNPWKEYIGCQADVFSLGIVFHQFCAPNGAAPECNTEAPWQTLVNGGKLHIHPKIERGFRDLIADMLEVDPSKRPAMAEVHRRLRDMDPRTGSKVSATSGHEASSRIDVHSDAKDDSKVSAKRKKFKPGPKKKSNGASVKEALATEKNPNKVEVFFTDGSTQIYDIHLAKAMNFII